MILGQKSRMRRIRSAQMRNAKNNNVMDEQKLFAFKYQNGESSSNTSSLECPVPPNPLNPTLLVSPVYQRQPSIDHLQTFQYGTNTQQTRQRPKTAKTNRYILSITIFNV